jgi:hypothetical protein
VLLVLLSLSLLLLLLLLLGQLPLVSLLLLLLLCKFAQGCRCEVVLSEYVLVTTLLQQRSLQLCCPSPLVPLLSLFVSAHSFISTHL